MTLTCANALGCYSTKVERNTSGYVHIKISEEREWRVSRKIDIRDVRKVDCELIVDRKI